MVRREAITALISDLERAGVVQDGQLLPERIVQLPTAERRGFRDRLRTIQATDNEGQLRISISLAKQIRALLETRETERHLHCYSASVTSPSKLRKGKEKQDADPLIEHLNGKTVQAVADGVGGTSGVFTLNNDDQMNGSRFLAETAVQAASEVISKLELNGEISKEDICMQLKGYIETRLREEVRAIRSASLKISGKAAIAATTLTAAMHYRHQGKNYVMILKIGDSPYEVTDSSKAVLASEDMRPGTAQTSAISLSNDGHPCSVHIDPERVTLELLEVPDEYGVFLATDGVTENKNLRALLDELAEHPSSEKLHQICSGNHDDSTGTYVQARKAC